ncbi:MAG: hypothetical protein V7749_00840 [Cocleimonas sp.]
MYPKGNLNRIWLVLGAIDSLEKATLVNISQSIDMPKGSVNDVLKKLINGQVAGVKVKKEGAVYLVEEWLEFRLAIKCIFEKHSLKQ